MDENLGFIGFVLLFVFVIGILVYFGIEDSKQRAAYKVETQQQYAECLKTESKFICESYKNSRLALQAAKDAESSADSAAMMGAVGIGFSAGRR